MTKPPRYFLFTIVLLAMVLAGCGSSQSVSTPGQTPEAGSEPAAPESPKILNLGTNPVGSLINNLGAGIASVASKYSGVQVRVMPTTGAIEWVPMVQSNEVHLGVLNSWDAQMGRQGKYEYEAATGGQGAPISLLASGTRSYVGVIVVDKSPIRSLRDLKGKRFVLTVTGSGGITAQNRAALANAGLTESDVTALTVPGINEAVQMVIEGRADATTITMGNAKVTELDAEQGARYLSLDPSPEAARRLQERFPCRLERVEPGPGRIGVKEPVYMMVYDFYLVGSERLSEETAYQIVKALWEHNEELGAIHAQLKDWSRERFANPNATIPYHPGAIKFYKQVGAWGPEMDRIQDQLLAGK